MKSTATRYDELRETIGRMEIVDCHEHITSREKQGDILEFISTMYQGNDFASIVGQPAVDRFIDGTLSLEERWPVFEKAWKASQFTGYGVGTRLALRKVFGSDEVTLENLKTWQSRLPDFSDPSQFDPLIKDARIVASVSDNFPDANKIWNNTFAHLPWQHLVISLPGLHSMTRRSDIETLERLSDQSVTSLDEYISLCGRLFERWIEAGAVAMKDQSAYTRSISYAMPTRTDAERIFNRMLSDERYAAEYDPNDNPLSDYLMHSFMRLARDLNLPVQLHTGHMAGHRNDVTKANAAGLRPLIETHRDVQFDLFHANWPYAGDILFLAKNYANVSVDMCWAYAIDPLYSKDFLKRAVATIGYTKIHGFGSDVHGTSPHMVWAYSEIARDVIAAALAELVDEDYVSLANAEEIAAAWLHDNPMRFFGLG